MLLLARAGLHLGPVILRENAVDDLARGAMAADDGDEAACRRLMDKPHGTYCPKVSAWKT